MQNERKKANLKGNRVLVLASGSPRRTELLNSAGITHQVVVSKGEELKLHPDGPLELVKQNARIKAVEVSNRYPDHLILGADTIVSLNEKVFGKPRDLDQAKQMLLTLSGKTHLVSTGICLCKKRECFLETRVESSKVTFKKIEDQIIEEYFSAVDPLDKAGSYAMQTRPELIIEKFSGSRSNVVGLPMELLKNWLEEIGFKDI